MWFSLRKDIFNHKDIFFSFFNNSSIFFMINVYSNKHYSALKYLKNTEVNLQNVLIMASNFNTRSNNWYLLYFFHSIYSDTLLEIADFFDFSLSSLIWQVSTCYSNNANNMNSVIDLFFLWSNSTELNNYIILPELWFPSDHTLLIVNISINEEFIQEKHQTIIKNSKEESKFTLDLIEAIGNIETTTILNKDVLEYIIQEYTRISELIWYKYSRVIKITK